MSHMPKDILCLAICKGVSIRLLYAIVRHCVFILVYMVEAYIVRYPIKLNVSEGNPGNVELSLVHY